jgi:hypothetical protein
VSATSSTHCDRRGACTRSSRITGQINEDVGRFALSRTRRTTMRRCSGARADRHAILVTDRALRPLSWRRRTGTIRESKAYSVVRDFRSGAAERLDGVCSWFERMVDSTRSRRRRAREIGGLFARRNPRSGRSITGWS